LWRLFVDGCGDLFCSGRFDLLRNLLNWGRGCDSLDCGLCICRLVRRVVALRLGLLAGRALAGLGLFGGRRRRLLHAVGGRNVVLGLLVLLGILSKEAEDVIEDEVAIGLLGEDEGLRKASVRQALVGDFANDLDDDIGVGALRVDVGDADFGVLEVQLLDAILDGLVPVSSAWVRWEIGYIPSGLRTR
jgi:hypothetical protein